MSPPVDRTETRHPFELKIEAYICARRLIREGEPLGVAVSGGPDSVALFRVLLALCGRLGIDVLTVLHFNHRLRGAESDEDARFVRRLTESAGLGLETGEADVSRHARERGLSLEMAARECRHRFFRETLLRLNVPALALGHNADDQAEEVLLRLMRGAGPAGAAGMDPRSRDGIVRPLLCARRTEILAYLADLGQSYRTDASNEVAFCQRNRLRLEVFPLLERVFHPNVADTLARHADLVRDEESYWETRVEAAWRDVAREAAAERVGLSIPALRELHVALRRRLYRRGLEAVAGNLFGIFAVHLQAVDWLTMEAQSGRSLDLPHGLKVLRDGDRIVFTMGGPESAEPLCMTIPAPGVYRSGRIVLELSERAAESLDLESPPAANAWEAWLDADGVRWPLTLRHRRPGDRFQPLGMDGSRKLKEFLIDEKVPLTDRDRIPLLCDADTILWVVGHRLSHRTRLTAAPRRVLVARLCFSGGCGKGATF